MVRLALSLCAALVLAGCATLSPRFSQEVAASFAHEDMRRLETAHLEIYYPARFQDEARRIATRLEQCATKLRALEVRQRNRDKLAVFLTSADFNNAYVQAIAAGNPQQMVLPLHMSTEVFDLYDIGTNATGDVSCHESVHYVTFEQVEGFWRGLNFFFGGVLTPEVFLDSWFHEGMATYYEARLGKPVGRPFSPFWRGAFAAGVASEPDLDAGFLNAEQRLQSPYGPQYLTGLAFVDYLARRFGEDKLWKLIDLQSRSIFSPLGVTLRFKRVYGLSIGALFDDFVKDVKEHEVKRARPADQRILAGDVGYSARIATAPDGTVASVASGRDKPATLTLRNKDGTVRASRRLAEILPFRRWVLAGASTVSGMSFTPDSRWLYLLAADLQADTSFTGRLWRVDARTAQVDHVADDVPGPGGCVTADGAGYVYVEYMGDAARLVRYDLSSGRRDPVATFPRATSVSAPACSPDGARIAFAERGDRGLDLYVRESSGEIVPLTSDGRFNSQPRWIDATHLLFVRELDGRSQVHVLDVTTKAFWPTTDAPFGALDPVPFGAEVAFLNRDGWGFSLDTAPLKLMPDPATSEDAHQVPTTDAAFTMGPIQPLQAALPAVEPAPAVQVVADEPYSALDHLLRPSLRVPYLVPFATTDQDKHPEYHLAAALSLQGSDRLGFHLWALNLAYDSRDRLPSASVAYGNGLLAPWFLSVSGAAVNVGPAYNYVASARASRTFWTTPVTLRFRAIEHHDILVVDTNRSKGLVVGQDRFIGPGMSVSYWAGESTLYGGIRRGLGFGASGDWYPKEAGSDFNLGDVSGEVDVWLPLPFSRRHQFAISGRGRTLLGSPNAHLLEVGGLARGLFPVAVTVERMTATRAVDGQLLAAGNLVFSEFLRGYPDETVRGTRMAAASASYLYPVVIDYGWASLFYLLPPFFVRQIDLEAWGEAAWIGPSTVTRRSAGGALHVRTAIGAVPLTLFLEAGQRFDARKDLEAYFGLSFE